MPRPARGEGQAWIGAAALASVVAYSGIAAWTEPTPIARAELHTRWVLALGYGHLLASVARRREDTTPTAPRPRLGTIAVLLAGYAVYAELCQLWRWLPLALLAVSAWHTVENDRAIRRSCLADASPIAPVSLRRWDVAVDACAAVAISLLAWALPACSPRIDMADVVAAFSLHHLFTWLILVAARARAHGVQRETWLRLVRLHVPMLAVCGGCVAIVEASAAPPPPIVEAAETILSPATYLYWSAAHALHTAWRRGAC